MVTALRPGPLPSPPAQTQRTDVASRLPDFTRSLPTAEAGAAPGKAPTPAPIQAATPAAVARPPSEADPPRPLRTTRPGSVVDIRV